MNFKLIIFVAMVALLGLSAFVSAGAVDEEPVGTTTFAPPRRQSVVKGCEAKTRDACKKCCEGQDLQFQFRSRCVCSRFFN